MDLDVRGAQGPGAPALPSGQRERKQISPQDPPPVLSPQRASASSPQRLI